MKILLLAYACEPNRGSEPGIGWHWAINLASDQTKEIHVLTRTNNKNAIENYLKDNPINNLFFHYYELPTFFVWAKHHFMPINIYYALWLWRSSNLADKMNRTFNFDMAHHITFGVFRDASFLYKLKIPYIIGPVGGGDTIPNSLTKLLSLKNRIHENIRLYYNQISLLNPFLIKTFDNASLILTKTGETAMLLKRWSNKTSINLEIGIDKIIEQAEFRVDKTFLYVGRFTYLKGIKLILMAFQKYSLENPNAKLIMIGKGEMEQYIHKFCFENNLHNNIQIIPWLKQEELKQYYMSCKALLFPSLHDSSGNVVLEAISYGTPVICLDCGGPTTVLGNTLSELTVATNNVSISDVINDIYRRMSMLTTDIDKYQQISKKCSQRAQDFLWGNVVSNCYTNFEKNFNVSSQ